MKPLRLYLENFTCHKKSFIDFTEFNSALIIGKIEGSDLESNGVGKTSLFKSIEYVLFNQADIPLDRLIREDTDSCQVTFDFYSNNNEYRIIRTRTKKGNTDVSLFQRNAVSDLIEKIYHSDDFEPVTDEKYWKSLSGRRAQDTEKELNKIIKINYKGFISTVHFVQRDLSGLATATPEKRKSILKDALNLGIYLKLEKIAKEKTSILSKEINKIQITLDNLNFKETDIETLNNELLNASSNLDDKNSIIVNLNKNINDFNDKINNIKNIHSGLTNKFSLYLEQEKNILNDKSKIEISVKEYKTKKSNAIKLANELVNDFNSLKEQQKKLNLIDYSVIDALTIDLEKDRNIIADKNAIIKNSMIEYQKLQVPLPDDSLCRHCRQPLSEEHRKICQQDIDKSIQNHALLIKEAKTHVNELTSKISRSQLKIHELSDSKKKLEFINSELVNKNKEIEDKKNIYEEYSVLLDKFITSLTLKEQELEEVLNILKNSSFDEAKELQNKIDGYKEEINKISIDINLLNKEVTHLNNKKAIIQHNIEQKTKDKIKFDDLNKNLFKYNSEMEIFPLVVQGFSSTGIPNLIIQNVLDDFQIEANDWLNRFKPGLQLSFSIEKINSKDQEVDTLDIHYQLNGRERYYEQLSGAMQLMVSFSLKLGLSSLLQKMIGADIKFLLLDEIDPDLDKARVDAFADLVKSLQKDFNILVITHNDRLKDKFTHAVLVEQDINGVSNAKVVTTW